MRVRLVQEDVRPWCSSFAGATVADGGVEYRPAVSASASALEHFQVLIVGAGLSGVDMAYHLQRQRPGDRYAILEARARIGGTWDLFRYPGIRSDSDMLTLGFPFRPWRGEKSIADGGSIRDYIQETAEVFGIDRHVRFGHRVVQAAWDSSAALWTLDVLVGEETTARRLTCGFLVMCSGYYDYDRAFTPTFDGAEDFKGRIIQPQFWPDNLDYAGKQVVVVGSGATAMTLVPAMARDAAHVTMLQRSPTYVVSRPAKDAAAAWLQARLPASLAGALARWKNILLGIATYRFARNKPDKAKRLILGGVRRALGPDFDVATHFTPRYNPWDQRVCLVPDGDLFKTLRGGRASIVTDQIERFTSTGLRLKSGAEAPADIVVLATGLVIKLMGGAQITVDGQVQDLSKAMLYKGMMFSDVPNLALAFGYTNASWTLKCDLTARYVCRLLGHMQHRKMDICAPRVSDPSVQPEPMLDFSSGYVQRAAQVMPRQGSKAPWRVHQNYVSDMLALKFGRLRDGAMTFARADGGARQ
jgi:cation diffusion facilitator CzcD-associated flavoprotein CzcO